MAEVAQAAVSNAGAIPFAFPGLDAVGCLFGTARSGSLVFPSSGAAGPDKEPIRRARAALRQAAGISRWVELNQVHGDELLVDPEATSWESGPDALPALPAADGSMTDRPGLGLCIKTADCQPLFLAHPRGCVAALHVGWRGNRLNFPGSGVARFCETYGLDPAEILAVRGPSLGPEAAEFVNFQKEWPKEFRPWFNDAARTMDLWSLTRDQLRAAGLRHDHIFSVDLCTRSLPDFFFSYRRGESARQISLIWLRGK